MSAQSWPDWLPLRDDLRTMSPYGAPQIPVEATLNTNENPYPPSPELVSAIADRVKGVASTLNRYPDRDAVLLRRSLAGFINELSGTTFSENNIWAANGSNEVIQSLFLAFNQRPALGFIPSYSMHPLIAKVIGLQFIDGGRNPDFTLDIEKASLTITREKPGLTFITTPNNPTGTVVSLDDIERLALATQDIGGLLIIDEAYAEFSEVASAVTLLEKYPHLVIIRTMSKAFAFAGARLGYLVASPELVQSMFLVRLPYHLSSLTQAAAEVALEYRRELLGTVSHLIDSRRKMERELESIGLEVLPSQGNFILFGGFNAPAPQVWQMFLDRGVLIRDVGLSGYLRVTMGNDAENEKFIEVMREIRKDEQR
jgi:histidinol-phosphate aminotransferase